jgi:hypothetical protein
MGLIKLTKTGFKYYEYDREEPLPHLLTCLKDIFQIELGVTFNDFLQALQEQETFYGLLGKSIATRLYYDCWEYKGEHIPDTITIRRQVDINDGFFRLVPETNGPIPIYYGDLPLIIDPKLEVCDVSVHCDFTFLEAIYSLLGMDLGQVNVKKDGFYDIDGVTKIDPIDHLMCYCEFDSDVTLLDIFNMVANHGLLKYFISLYSNAPHINAYHRAAREQPTEIIDFHYLEVYEISKIYHKKNYNWYEFGNPDFHGIGPLDPSENKYYDEHPEQERPSISYMAIEFYHPSVIANLPIRITTEYNIWDYNKSRKPIFTGEKKFTLLEVLDAIYDEITFFGLPSNGVAKLAEINEQIDQIKENILTEEDGEGEMI